MAGLADAAEHPTTPVATRWRPPPGPLQPIRALRRRRAARRPAATVREVERRARFADDLRALADLLEQHRSPAFDELVDPGAVRRAVGRADTAFVARRTLFDAATAAIWLDGGEAEVPGLSRR